MRAPALLLLACFVPATAEPAAAASCSAQDNKVKQLTQQLQQQGQQAEQIVAELKQAQAALKQETTLRAQAEEKAKQSSEQCAQGQEFSVINVVTTSGSIAKEMIQHALDQTDIDEKVVSTASVYTGQASGLVTEAADRITKMDYYGSVANLAQNELYLKHIAPHVQTIRSTAQPHVDQYVSPALETAKIYANPAIETVAKTYASAAETVETQVVPTLKPHLSKTYELVTGVYNDSPQHIGRLHAMAQKLLDPVFILVAKAAPRHKDILPKHPVDRLLLLVCMAVIAYHLAFWMKLVLRIVLKLSKWASTVLYRLGFKLPLKVTGKTISWSFWFGTGFYVCGLCKSRKKKLPEGNGKKNGVHQKATVAEVVELLEKSKKKGKLPEGVKSLCKTSKSGTTLSSPDEMKGKTVPKEVLKQACAKFKDVDMKKLDL